VSGPDAAGGPVPTRPARVVPCRGCRAPIWKLANDTTRLLGPIEVDPHERGNITVDLAAGSYRVLAGPALAAARAEGRPLHRNHFADCPQADRFHRRPARRPAPPRSP
jgi:hypothetical protein